MSPDEDLAAMQQLLAGSTEAFGSTLATTIDQVRAMLPADGADEDAESGFAELGHFASGRIDTSRFASLVVRRRALDPTANGVIQRALTTLSGLADRGEALANVDIAPGDSLYGAVRSAVTQIGRAFGAARVIELVRGERFETARHDSQLEGFPFARWNRTERCLAPPLLVDLDGSDLHAAALTEFLDGAMRFVFRVRGDVPPAPLAALVAPGTFVMQTNDSADLQRLLEWDGPGVAAIVPDCCARFVHDPAGGAEAATRLTVQYVPEELPNAPVGGISIAQQTEQLRLLNSLAEKPAVALAPVPPQSEQAPPAADAAKVQEPQADPVGKLAAWLLASANLSDLP